MIPAVIAGSGCALPQCRQSDSMPAKKLSDVLESPSLVEQITIGLMSTATGIWFFMIGASFGSFLNVVVYRMPRGKSLWRTPSACPRCDNRIRLKDNIPVVGWLKLGGKCRDCSLPIPIRYPSVEFVAGAIFVLFLFAELVSGGANLPIRPIDSYPGITWAVWSLRYPDLIQLYLYHMLWLMLVLAVMLIGLDRQRVPQGLLVFGLMAGLAWLCVEPRLHPVANIVPATGAGVWTGGDWFANWTWSQRGNAVGQGVFGWLWGGAVGSLITLPVARRLAGAVRLATISVCGLGGLYLGPESVTSLALIIVICRAGFAACASFAPMVAFWGQSWALLLGSVVQLTAWRWLVSLSHWPGPGTSAGWQLIGVAATVGLAFAGRLLREPVVAAESGPAESETEAKRAEVDLTAVG